VVPIINLSVVSGPTDISCAHVGAGDDGTGATMASVGAAKVVRREIEIPVALDGAVPARLFVLATSKAARAKAAADALGP